MYVYVSQIDTWVNLIKDILTDAAVLVTAWVAVQGLDTWRRQMVGNAELEMMRNILRAAFKVQDELKIARDPYTSFTDGIHPVKDTFTVSMIERAEEVFISRWEKVRAARAELGVASMEALIIWGQDAHETMSLLDGPYFRLRNSFEEYMVMKGIAGEMSAETQRKDAEMHLRKVVYFAGGKEPDDLEKEIQAAISKIEKFVEEKSKYKVRVNENFPRGVLHRRIRHGNPDHRANDAAG